MYLLMIQSYTRKYPERKMRFYHMIICFVQLVNTLLIKVSSYIVQVPFAGFSNVNDNHYHLQDDDGSEIKVTFSSSKNMQDYLLIIKDVFCDQYQAQINKAYRIMGLMRRTNTYPDKEFCKIPIPSFGQTTFGVYAAGVWKPHLIRDTDLLESVQIRAKRLLPSLKG